MTFKYKVILVGCGKMGSSILSSLAKSKLDIEIYVIDPNIQNSANIKNNHIYFLDDIHQLPQDFTANIILFAVKPQIIQNIAKPYHKLINHDTIIMSLLAGISVDFFSNLYGTNTQIVRFMPNLGAEFNKSTSFIYAKNLAIKPTIIERFISAFGDYVWLDEEDKMHQATAVSGSGPAYYFLFFKYFTEFLSEHGFDETEAKNIILNTCEAALLMAKENKNFDDLINAVTSPNGTTFAALESFKNNNQLQNIFNQALTAATKRSKKLSNAI